MAKIFEFSGYFVTSNDEGECGYVHKELQLSDRTYVCPVCGIQMKFPKRTSITRVVQKAKKVFENTIWCTQPDWND